MSQVDEFNEISFRIMQLSREAKEQGLQVNAERLVEVAADFELLSDDLQMCWGGPLNGQAGRRAIFEQLLSSVAFDAILETGTYRGITTEWLAERFSGPIASCELEKIYLRQAQSRLADYRNVSLNLLDSREFLTRFLQQATADTKFFIYLDAHWKDDLPLQRELEIIDASGLPAVIAIDDFRVPGDPGYQYDDYGPGKALTIDLLEFLRTKGYRIYFPALPADLEDGSKRGVCVLTKSLIAQLDGCDLLRGADWADWRIIELEALYQGALQKAELYDALMSQQGEPTPAVAAIPEPELAAPSEPDPVPEMEPEPEPELQVEPEPDPYATALADWLPVAEKFLDKLSPDVDAELATRLAPDLAMLLSRHGEFELVLDQLATHADLRSEDIRERIASGRALVEERAHTLQLVRQIHHLRERLHQNQVDAKTTFIDNSGGRVIQSMPSFDKEVVLRIIGELKASRGLKLLSHLAPSARLNVIRLESEVRKAGLHNL